MVYFFQNLEKYKVVSTMNFSSFMSAVKFKYSKMTTKFGTIGFDITKKLLWDLGEYCRDLGKLGSEKMEHGFPCGIHTLVCGVLKQLTIASKPQ